MRYWSSTLPILAAAIMFYFAAPVAHLSKIAAADGTPANLTLSTSDSNGTSVSCKDLPEAAGGVLLGYIMPCISYTIEQATQKFTIEMVDMLKPMVFAFITFVVVMFGVKILQVGEHDIKKDGMVLVLKIAFVVGMLELIPNFFVPQVYAVMAESQTVVLGALNNSSLVCNVDDFSDANTPKVWAMMDCVLGKLYGFTSDGAGGKNMVLAASAFGVAAGFFFGGSLGIIVFFALIGVLVSFFMLVLRTAVAFVNGYLIVCLMLIISPIFMPLVLLRATAGYFEPWWKNIAAGLLMPIIITSYSMIALVIYDKLLFDPGSSNPPREPALINKLFDSDLMKQAQQLPKQPCSKMAFNDPEKVRQGTGWDVNKFLTQQPVIKFFDPTQGGANDLCAGVKLPVLNLKDTNDPKFQSEKESFTQLFMDCLKLLVLAFIANSGAQQVMRMVGLMTGSSAAAASLQASSPVEKKIEGAFANAKAEMMATAQKYSNGNVSRFGEATGAEFVRQLPNAIKNYGSGFLEGIRK